eukprot:5566060-Pleurochrysis_carterae.AAC.1
MAEPASGQAGAILSQPTIPVSIRQGSQGTARAERTAGGRTGGGGRAPCTKAGSCIGSTQPTATRALGLLEGCALV